MTDIPVTKSINGVNVPAFVGDSAYPMLPWLINPYSQPNLRRQHINNGQIVVKIPFWSSKSLVETQ